MNLGTSSQLHGLQQWRWILPAVNIVFYGVLVGSSQPPTLPPNLAIDPAAYMGRRIAFAVNSPATLLGLTIGNLFGEHAAFAADICAGVLLLPQWYAVGLWADYRHSRSGLPRRSMMTVSASGFSLVLVVFLSAWHRVLNEPRLFQSETIEVLFGCIAWPAFLLWCFGRTFINQQRSASSR